MRDVIKNDCPQTWLDLRPIISFSIVRFLLSFERLAFDSLGRSWIHEHPHRKALEACRLGSLQHGNPICVFVVRGCPDFCDLRIEWLELIDASLQSVTSLLHKNKNTKHETKLSSVVLLHAVIYLKMIRKTGQRTPLALFKLEDKVPPLKFIKVASARWTMSLPWKS